MSKLGKINIGDLQDAMHYAIMAVGGIDKHGRESTFSGRAAYEMGRKVPRTEWTRRAQNAIREAGLPVPPHLKGERLIKFIDRVAHAVHRDAYSTQPISGFALQVADLSEGANLPNWKIKGRKRVSGRRQRGRARSRGR